MHYIIILTLLLSTLYAYEQKIDMHGGKKTPLYSKDKKTFKSPNMKISNFLDDNKTKEHPLQNK